MFAADAVARLSGTVGVAAVTAGPGICPQWWPLVATASLLAISILLLYFFAAYFFVLFCAYFYLVSFCY